MGNIPILFEKQFKSRIWGTYYDAATNQLALEIRNEQKHETRFFILSLDKFQWKLKNFLFEEERWWCSLVGITSQMMILQVYDNLDNPDAITYYGVSLSSKTVSWKTSGISCRVITEDFFQASNLKTGEVACYCTLSGKKVFNHKTDINLSKESPLNPKFYHIDNHYFSQFQQLIAEKFNVSAVLGCDYLEYGDFIIISYYIRCTDGYECYLLVLNPEGETLFFTLLERSLRGLIGNSFFVADEKLFFVRDKNQICVYDLC